MAHKAKAFPTEAIPEHLRDVIARVAEVGAQIALRIARGGIEEDLAGAEGINSDGDAQKALDVIADDAFSTALATTPVRYYASEEQEVVVEINPKGDLALAIDPLD